MFKKKKKSTLNESEKIRTSIDRISSDITDDKRSTKKTKKSVKTESKPIEEAPKTINPDRRRIL